MNIIVMFISLLIVMSSSSAFGKGNTLNLVCVFNERIPLATSLEVDFDKSTVNGLPATISDDMLRWRADDFMFTINRKTATIVGVRDGNTFVSGGTCTVAGRNKF